MISSVVFGLIFVSFLFWWFLVREKPVPKGLKKIPGPKPHFLFGNAKDFGNPSDFHKLIIEMHEKYGDYVQLKIPGGHLVLIGNPEAAKLVYSNQKRFDVVGGEDKGVSSVLGDITLTLPPKEWSLHRKLIAPQLALPNVLQNVAMITVKQMNILFKILETPAKNHTAIDVSPYFFNLTLDVISQAVLDYDIGCLEKPSSLSDAFHALMKEIQWRGRVVPFPFLWKFFYQREKDYNEKKKLITDLVEKMIKYHRNNDLGHSIIKYFLQAKTENGNLISDKIIREETLNVFTGGHETTANTLGCIINHLSAHPEIQKKIQDEVDTVLQGRAPEYSDVSKFKYIDMVIKEGLRLDTPGLAFGRTALNDEEIDGYYVPKYSRVTISTYKIHRDPKIYLNPEEFKPERWETLDGKLSYIPFGGGVRVCAGQRLAKLEMQLIIAMLFQKYSFSTVEGKEVAKRSVQFTYGPKDGVWAYVHNRS